MVASILSVRREFIEGRRDPVDEDGAGVSDFNASIDRLID